MQTPRFFKINENFTCFHCGREVPPAQSTCRDHCPWCLYSQHVDNLPGDRQAHCQGVLEPIGWYQQKKKGMMIAYRCQGCGAQKVNRFLERDQYAPDSLDVLLKLDAILKPRDF